MWLLILTITISNSFSAGGAAATIQTIDGFHSEHACKQAGSKWLDSDFDGGQQSAICVRKTDEI